MPRATHKQKPQEACEACTRQNFQKRPAVRTSAVERTPSLRRLSPLIHINLPALDIPLHLVSGTPSEIPP